MAQYQLEIADAERLYDLPTGLLAGLIEQESNFNPQAVSPAGALGLTQIVPKWHPTVDPVRLVQDPKYSIFQGARILSERLRARKGDIPIALADYNAGQGNVNKLLASGKLPSETKAYVPGVLGKARQFGFNIGEADIAIAAQRVAGATSSPWNDTRDSALRAGQPVGTFNQQSTSEQETMLAAVVPDKTTSIVEELLGRVDKTELAVGKAQSDVDTVGINQQTELAKQARDILTMLGLNPEITNAEIGTTVSALKVAHSDLVNTQAALREDRQNPIFNVIDQLTRGKVTQIQTARIKQSTEAVTTLAQSLAQLQGAAAKQIQLDQTASNNLAEEEIKAKTNLNMARADRDAAKIGVREGLAAERRQMQDEVNSAKNATALEREQLRLAIDKIKLEQAKNPTAKLSAAERLNAKQKEVFDQLYAETATAMGMTTDQYDAVIARKGNEHLANYLVGENGELPLPLAKLKAAQGKYSQAETALFNKAHGMAGWASPNNPNNRLSEEYQALKATAAKGKRIPSDQIAEAEANETAIIATRKKSLIVNDGTETTLAENPYGANFGRLEQIAATPALAATNKDIKAVVESRLYQKLKEKNDSNSLDKRAVADTEVVDTAAEMMRRKELSPQEAAKQVADYYRAQVKANNMAFKFDQFGLPRQDNYPVPVANDMPKHNWINPKVSPAKGDKPPVAEFKTVDLTNEAQAKMILLMRTGPTQGASLGRIFRWAFIDPAMESFNQAGKLPGRMLSGDAK
jgi:hypothetical protein